MKVKKVHHRQPLCHLGIQRTELSATEQISEERHSEVLVPRDELLQRARICRRKLLKYRERRAVLHEHRELGSERRFAHQANQVAYRGQSGRIDKCERLFGIAAPSKCVIQLGLGIRAGTLCQRINDFWCALSKQLLDLL